MVDKGDITDMFSSSAQNGLYSQKTPQEQMMQQRQDAFFGAGAAGAQMRMPPPPPQQQQQQQQMFPGQQPPQQQPQMTMNPFGNAAASGGVSVNGWVGQPWVRPWDLEWSTF